MKNEKTILLVSLLVQFGLLFYFKYSVFAFSIIEKITSKIGITTTVPKLDIVSPVGLSFYLFQSVSYIVDVYRNKKTVEKNILKYALYISFFPKFLQGPIERSERLIPQFDNVKCDFDYIRSGLLVFLWGYFQKIIIADRIAIFVDFVYLNYVEYTGWYLIIATILFAFQIYCDFCGYSNIAKGSAMMMGIELVDNFDAPYLSFSVTEFWRKWHISLTSWFRDYIYIPLGGNRKGKIRKYINVFLVFLISGLWHGSSISFVVWGCLNGLYQILESVISPFANKIYTKIGIKKDNTVLCLLQMIKTFLLIDFSWIFFKTEGTVLSIEIIMSMLKANNINILTNGSLFNCGLQYHDFIAILISLIILAFIDYMKRRKISIIEQINKQNIVVRCLFVVLFICIIMVFGKWGPEFNKSNFIYQKF